MPLPWKKTRVTRISQFLADLQPPKRGGSLMVQPGFPTSLIDLFFKNRDHLKKPSKKNKSKEKSERVDDRVSDPITENSELGSSNLAILVKPSSAKLENLSRKEGDHGVEESGEIHVEDRAVVDEECVGGNWSAVLLAAVKMFLVVILALSTKKLAVGITLSAFLLLFLEYAGKHLACFFKPCSNAKFVFQNMAQKVSAFVLCLNGFNGSEDLKAAILRENNGDVVFELVDIRSESDSAIGEIQIDGPGGERTSIELLGADYEKKRAVDKGSVGEKTFAELLGMDDERRKVVDKRRGCSDKTVSLVKFLGTDYEKIRVVEGGQDGGEFVVDEKIKGSKNSKIKSKLIKKFVLKKLRRKGKQTEKELELEPVRSSEVSRYFEDEKVERCEEVEDHKDEKQEEQESENRSVFSVDADEKSESQGVDRVSDHGEGSLAGGETPLIAERKGREGEGNFGYLILFLVVLAGLFGGRIVALLLTITCCFIPKLAGSLRRSIKICP